MSFQLLLTNQKFLILHHVLMMKILLEVYYEIEIYEDIEGVNGVQADLSHEMYLTRLQKERKHDVVS